MKKIIIVGIICILMLIACFSPWRGGDFGTFSIITGSGDNGRKAWNDTDTNDLIHDILVIDSAGKEYSQKGIIGAQGVPFTVTPGPCNISVLAIMYEDEGESEILQAVGSRTVNINPGKNSAVSISMGEPNGEDYCKVIFELGNKTINRYVHAGQKVTVPKTFRDMKQILDAGLYRGTFYDYELSFVEYGKWYKGAGLFDVANVSITEDITLKGEWDIPERISFDAKYIVDPISDAINGYIDDSSGGGYKPGDYTLLLEEDIVTNVEGIVFLFNGPTVNLVLIGKEKTITIKPTSSEKGYYPIFSLSSFVNLTLGKNITLAGHTDNMSALVIISSGCTLTMLEGSKITGNTTGGDSVYGSGVYIEAGEFIMEGGEISNNDSKALTLTTGGGGVYVGGNGKFTMKGGSIINNSGGNGGGVYVGKSTDTGAKGTFTMEGGTISDNSAFGNGGGVYTNGDFIILKIPVNSSKATISKNYTEGDSLNSAGGGVYVTDGGTFNMGDGEISGNWTQGRGGGVYASGSFTKTGGIIFGYTGEDYLNQPGATENKAQFSNSTAITGNYGNAIYSAASTPSYTDNTLFETDNWPKP